MFRITKRIEIDMGHRIPNHNSQCKNFHGHRYKIEATILGELNKEEGESSEGMVLDFSDIKKILKEEIHNVYDHGFVMYTKDNFSKNIKEMLFDKNLKFIFVNFVPTVENLAEFWFKKIKTRIADLNNNNIMLLKLRVYETPNSWADFGDD